MTRGILLARLANFLEGHGAVRPELAEAVAGMLDGGPLPPVPAQGNGGAGEILALGHLFHDLCVRAGLEEKESLALVNGSPCAAALVGDAARVASAGGEEDHVLLAIESVGMESLCCGGFVGSKEVAVAVVAVFEGVTREQYEASVRKLTGGKGRLESPSDWPVDGVLAHIAGEGENGFRVVDVWESEEAFGRFGETLIPILQEIGVQGQPEVYPAHTFVSA